MPTNVSLKRMIAAMDLPCPTWESFLDPTSGEIVTVTDEQRQAVAHGDSTGLPQIRDALESPHYLMLPDQYEIHEWSIMKHFAQTQKNADVRHELLNALHGRQAFRTFRESLARHGLNDAWLDYRERALEEIARNWLEHYGIPYR